MPSTTVGRLVWVLPTAMALSIIYGHPIGLFAIPVLYVSLTLGWGSYMDIGRMGYGASNDNESIKPVVMFVVPKKYHEARLYDLIGMSIRGLFLTAPAGLITHNLLFAASGIFMGLIYEFSWQVGSDIKHFRGAELGELLFGIFMGSMLFINGVYL